MTTERQKAAARPNIKGSGKYPLSSKAEHAIASTKFAFPKERKEPLIDANHVRNAIARFNQVEGVSNAERDAAWRRIEAAARKYGIEISHRPRVKRAQ